MTSTVDQAVLAGLGGIALATCALLLARRGLLRLRYALGWICVAVCVVALAFLASAIKPLASSFGVSPTGLILALASGVLVIITLQITIAVSALRDDVQAIAEAYALVAERVGQLEARTESQTVEGA
jgi:hypothetical protein